MKINQETEKKEGTEDVKRSMRIGAVREIRDKKKANGQLREKLCQKIFKTTQESKHVDRMKKKETIQERKKEDRKEGRNKGRIRRD